MPRKILIVDDEALARRNIAVFLQRNGFDVVEAGDGKEAIALLNRNKVDLVITDIRMPRMNGLLLQDVISSAFPKTPVLLMTAYHTDLKAVMPDTFLQKPILLNELLAKTRKLLKETPLGKEGG